MLLTRIITVLDQIQCRNLIQNISQKGIELTRHLKLKLGLDALGIGFMIRFYNTRARQPTGIHLYYDRFLPHLSYLESLSLEELPSYLGSQIRVDEFPYHPAACIQSKDSSSVLAARGEFEYNTELMRDPSKRGHQIIRYLTLTLILTLILALALALAQALDLTLTLTLPLTLPLSLTLALTLLYR